MDVDAKWKSGFHAMLANLPEVARLKWGQSYSIWYVYMLIDPRNDEIFYVGVSGNPRQRFKGHVNDGSFWRRLHELRAAGTPPEMRVVVDMAHKSDAEAIEAQLIAGIPTVENLEKHPVGCRCFAHRDVQSTPRFNVLQKRFERLGLTWPATG